MSIGPADAPPGGRAVARLRLQGAGTTAAEGLDLEAADGNGHLLFKENTKGSDDADRWSIADSTGTEVAQTDHRGTRKGIELRVPGEAVHWRKAKFWQPAYAQVEGLCVMTKLRGRADKETGERKLLEVTVSDALAARPDGSLLLLLAVFTTYRDTLPGFNPVDASYGMVWMYGTYDSSDPDPYDSSDFDSGSSDSGSYDSSDSGSSDSGSSDSGGSFD